MDISISGLYSSFGRAYAVVVLLFGLGVYFAARRRRAVWIGGLVLAIAVAAAPVALFRMYVPELSFPRLVASYAITYIAPMLVTIVTADLLRRRVPGRWVAVFVLAATAWLAWTVAGYAAAPFSDLVQASG